MTVRCFSVTMVAFGVAGCGAGGRADVEPVVRDSAGIRIVENAAPMHTGDEAWQVEEEPDLRIGAVAGEPQYELDKVMGVLRLSDGRIAVADMGSSQVRFFDSHGTFLNAVGRRGRGPGEFGQLMRLLPYRGDTIVADGSGRFVFIAPDGAILNTVVPDPPTHSSLTASLPDGSLLVADGSWAADRIDEPITLQIRLLRIRLDGTHDEIGTLDGPVLHPGYMGMGQPEAFGAGVTIAGDGHAAWYGRADRWELRRVNPDGASTMIVRRAWTPVPVTEADRDAYTAAHTGGPGEGGGPVPERLRQQRLAMVEATVYAENLPAFGRLLVDRLGNIWVREYHRDMAMPVTRFHQTWPHPTRWSVLDPEGRWLTEVETPPDFEVFDIGDDYVAGLSRDAMDVEYVQVHRLVKPR